MAVALLLADRGADEPALGPEAAAQLADLGITHLALLRDSSGIGIVLEGWAFDPASTDAVVRAVFPGGDAAVRILHHVEQVAISRAPDGKGAR